VIANVAEAVPPRVAEVRAGVEGDDVGLFIEDRRREQRRKSTQRKVTNMEPVTITVQNLSSVVTDSDAQAISRALAVQATSDFNTSAWVTQELSNPIAGVQFIAKGAPVPPNTYHIELLDDSTQPGALGFHEDQAFDHTLRQVDTITGSASYPSTAVTAHPRKASTHSARGLRADCPEHPLAKVFCRAAQEDDASPSEVASHELLEMVVDPQVVQNVRTVVDYATKQRVIVEVGDPVQGTGYTIGDTLVANFALPAYFPSLGAAGVMDFRGVLFAPFPALTPDGYISVTPEDSEEWTQIFGSAG
jgi:hypothetical protein